MDLQALIDYAVAHHDWLLLAAASVALIVPIVMKLLGKQIPVVDSILTGALSLVTSWRKGKDDASDVAKAADQKGIAAVVPIDSAKKDEVKK